MTKQSMVALTGATGFIGSHICNTLHKAEIKTRVLIRNPDKLSPCYSYSDVIRGDLHDFSALSRLTEGADYLIHCAGRVRGHRAEQFDYDNTTGTQNIADVAANSTSLKKCIYISSLSARHPELSYYASSKYKSEQALEKAATNLWHIIRPPAVYGPGDKELRPLFDSMSRGVLWLPGAIENRFSLLHIYDLCHLILALIDSCESQNHIIEPDDGKANGYDWANIKEIASAYFERNIYTIPIPRLILTSAAQMNVLFSKVLNYMPMLTPEKVQELTYSNWVADQNYQALNWSPQYDFKTGLSTLYQ